MTQKNYRRRTGCLVNDENVSDHDEECRLAIEEMKFLQKQRERKIGIPAVPSTRCSESVSQPIEKNEVEGEKDEMVLQDTFAQETAVTLDDPNMVRYIEQELAKRRGKNIKEASENENDLKHAEDELFKVPDHLKVRKRNSAENLTQWTTGIAEVQLPIEYKLKNIEETEAAKKLLQENRLLPKEKRETTMPSNYSVDFLHRGQDQTRKLVKDIYKHRDSKETESGTELAVCSRQAATDDFVLERFRKRHRAMQR